MFFSASRTVKAARQAGSQRGDPSEPIAFVRVILLLGIYGVDLIMGATGEAYAELSIALIAMVTLDQLLKRMYGL